MVGKINQTACYEDKLIVVSQGNLCYFIYYLIILNTDFDSSNHVVRILDVLFNYISHQISRKLTD